MSTKKTAAQKSFRFVEVIGGTVTAATREEAEQKIDFAGNDAALRARGIAVTRHVVEVEGAEPVTSGQTKARKSR